MKHRWFALALIVLVGVTPHLSLGQSDVTRREIISRPIQAMGGQDALRRLERLQLKGEVQQWEPTQSYVPGGEARFTGDSTVTISRDFTRNAARLDWDRHLVYPSTDSARSSPTGSGTCRE